MDASANGQLQNKTNLNITMSDVGAVACIGAVGLMNIGALRFGFKGVCKVFNYAKGIVNEERGFTIFRRDRTKEKVVVFVSQLLVAVAVVAVNIETGGFLLLTSVVTGLVGGLTYQGALACKVALEFFSR